jgi:hypothetical protein
MGDNYQILYETTLNNVIENWNTIRQNENLMSHLKNNNLCTQMKESERLNGIDLDNDGNTLNQMNTDEWIYARVLTYQIICKYLLSSPFFP